VQRGSSPPRVDRFEHEAAFYHGSAGLADVTVPFVEEGLQRSEPVLVALLPDRIRTVRAALGRDADRVAFLDLAWVGRNPARILSVWQHFVRTSRGGPPPRGIGEPVWSGRTEAEVAECHLHESLLNVAFDGGTPWRLMCPYDEGLPRPVVEEAMRTHPVRTRAAATVAYAGHAYARDVFASPLPPAPVEARNPPAPEDPAATAAVVRTWASDAGLPHRRAADLATAVREVLGIAGEPAATVVRAWTEAGSFVVEVAGGERLTDPLVGRDPAAASAGPARGLWIAHQLCDLVQVRSPETGTVVRLHVSL
jgi:hypothetical protein